MNFILSTFNHIHSYVTEFVKTYHLHTRKIHKIITQGQQKWVGRVGNCLPNFLLADIKTHGSESHGQVK